MRSLISRKIRLASTKSSNARGTFLIAICEQCSDGQNEQTIRSRSDHMTGRGRAPYFFVAVQFIDRRTHHTVCATSKRFQRMIFCIDGEFRCMHHEVVGTCIPAPAPAPDEPTEETVSRSARGRFVASKRITTAVEITYRLIFWRYLCCWLHLQVHPSCLPRLVSADRKEQPTAVSWPEQLLQQVWLKAVYLPFTLIHCTSTNTTTTAITIHHHSISLNNTSSVTFTAMCCLFAPTKTSFQKIKKICTQQSEQFFLVTSSIKKKGCRSQHDSLSVGVPVAN